MYCNTALSFTGCLSGNALSKVLKIDKSEAIMWHLHGYLKKKIVLNKSLGDQP